MNSDKNVLRVAKIINDSIVDGPGIRAAVFTQGCTHGCPGCHNPQTHDINGGYLTTIQEILDVIDKNPLLDGVTFTGGEPFLQAESLFLLAREIKKRGLSLMIYTGFLWEELIDNPDYFRLIRLADIVVDGPFIEAGKSHELLYKGSQNQRVIMVQESLGNGKRRKRLPLDKK